MVALTAAQGLRRTALNTRSHSALPALRLPKRHSRVKLLSTGAAMAEVSSAVGADCWAATLESAAGSKRVLFNAYGRRGQYYLSPGEEAARSHIVANPGSVLERLRAAPGTKAVFYLFPDASTITRVSYAGNGKFRVEDHSDSPIDW